MKHRIYTQLSNINYSVGMSGEGNLEGKITVDICVDCTIPKVTTATQSSRIKVETSMRNLPNDVQSDLRKIFNKIQKLVEDEYDGYSKGEKKC